jgi:hypothetical protein
MDQPGHGRLEDNTALVWKSVALLPFSPKATHNVEQLSYHEQECSSFDPLPSRGASGFTCELATSAIE